VLRHEPISRLFKEVEQAFRNQAIARMRAEGIPDLFPGLMPLVLHLGDEDGLTMSELARRCGLENSTLTPLVDELERQGLAARQRDPSDRRVVHIGLTESGRNLQPRLRSIVLKLQDDALAGIPAEDLNTFRRVLEQLLANLG
jgi:DNA-binding MarR family transcriptional regulator